MLDNVDIKFDKGRMFISTTEYEKVLEKASYITPVPGGVGPMTIAMLIHNVVIAAKYLEEK